jgi:hypothetical protein
VLLCETQWHAYEATTSDECMRINQLLRLCVQPVRVTLYELSPTPLLHTAVERTALGGSRFTSAAFT